MAAGGHRFMLQGKHDQNEDMQVQPKRGQLKSRDSKIHGIEKCSKSLLYS